MERLELAIAGVEQALRRPTSADPRHPVALAAVAAGTPAPASVVTAAPSVTWAQLVRQQLPRLVQALVEEPTDIADHALTPRARRLAAERNRLLLRLGQLAPGLSDACLAPGADAEHLRRMLLRLVHDIAHHHQRVNDLVYDAGWRDVGGSE